MTETGVTDGAAVGAADEADIERLAVALFGGWLDHCRSHGDPHLSAEWETHPEIGREMFRSMARAVLSDALTTDGTAGDTEVERLARATYEVDAYSPLHENGETWESVPDSHCVKENYRDMARAVRAHLHGASRAADAAREAEIARLRQALEAVGHCAGETLDETDSEIPPGERGRDKAFAVGEAYAGALQFIARHADQTLHWSPEQRAALDAATPAEISQGGS